MALASVGICTYPPTYIIKNNTINKSSSNSSYRQWVKFVQALYLKRDNNNSHYNPIQVSLMSSHETGTICFVWLYIVLCWDLK